MLSMLYLEHKPSPPLSGLINALWYCCAPDLLSGRQRVLPTGSTQIILSLASDALTECIPANGTSPEILLPMPSAILTGPRLHYGVIHTRDLAELIGVSFRPGGLGPWLRQPVTDVFEQSIPFGSVFKDASLRGRLQEAPTPRQKLALLDHRLVVSLRGTAPRRKPVVQAALHALSRHTVRQAAAELQLSERRLHQVFSEEVGLSPKQWSRIQRFQRAVRALHRGVALPWEQLALHCGYYDQSHFSNDFRAFSGIDPTTYTSLDRPWANHLIIRD